MSAAEARLLAGLAPLAGSSARALKRFVNLYRLARAQNHVHKGAVAFMLALDAGGTQAEIAAVNEALSRAEEARRRILTFIRAARVSSRPWPQRNPRKARLA